MFGNIESFFVKNPSKSIRILGKFLKIFYI